MSSSSRNSSKSFNVYVVNELGETMKVRLHPWSLVKDLKDHLQEKGFCNGDAGHQRIFFGGNELRNTRTLHDAGIRRGSRLVVTPAFSANNAMAANAIHPYGGVRVPRMLRRIIADCRRALLMNLVPRLALDGVGGTYFLRGPDKRNLAVFKPGDEEPFAPNNPKGHVGILGQPSVFKGIKSGEGYIREVAASLLDHDSFSGVPFTTLVEMPSSIFHNASQTGYKATPDGSKMKVGAFQQFVECDDVAANWAPQSFPVDEVQKIAILDIRLANSDRNDANILVIRDREKQKVSLLPIDHSYCLPDTLELAWTDWVWLQWPQAKAPLEPAAKEYILGLDIKNDQRLLREKLSIREPCLHIMRITGLLLQEGVRAGLTLYEIGSIMTREDIDKPSTLEVMCSQARFLAHTAKQNVRLRSKAPLRRQRSGSERSASATNEDDLSALPCKRNVSQSEVLVGRTSNVQPPPLTLTASKGSVYPTVSSPAVDRILKQDVASGYLSSDMDSDFSDFGYTPSPGSDFSPELGDSDDDGAVATSGRQDRRSSLGFFRKNGSARTKRSKKKRSSNPKKREKRHPRLEELKLGRSNSFSNFRQIAVPEEGFGGGSIETNGRLSWTSRSPNPRDLSRSVSANAGDGNDNKNKKDCDHDGANGRSNSALGLRHEEDSDGHSRPDTRRHVPTHTRSPSTFRARDDGIDHSELFFSYLKKVIGQLIDTRYVKPRLEAQKAAASGTSRRPGAIKTNPGSPKIYGLPPSPSGSPFVFAFEAPSLHPPALSLGSNDGSGWTDECDTGGNVFQSDLDEEKSTQRSGSAFSTSAPNTSSPLLSSLSSSDSGDDQPFGISLDVGSMSPSSTMRSRPSLIRPQPIATGSSASTAFGLMRGRNGNSNNNNSNNNDDDNNDSSSSNNNNINSGVDNSTSSCSSNRDADTACRGGVSGGDAGGGTSGDKPLRSVSPSSADIVGARVKKPVLGGKTTKIKTKGKAFHHSSRATAVGRRSRRSSNDSTNCDSKDDHEPASSASEADTSSHIPPTPLSSQSTKSARLPGDAGSGEKGGDKGTKKYGTEPRRRPQRKYNNVLSFLLAD